jgi:hypothetical protein
MNAPVLQLDLESEDPEARAVAAVRDAIDQARGDVLDGIVDFVARQRALGRLTREQSEFADELLNALGVDR